MPAVHHVYVEKTPAVHHVYAEKVSAVYYVMPQWAEKLPAAVQHGNET